MQFTTVKPGRNTLPDAGTHDICSPGQLSVTFTVNCTTASHLPVSMFTDMSGGQLSVGRSLSVTVTANVHVVLFPLPSVAVQTTFV
jgi:hypothetical protein